MESTLLHHHPKTGLQAKFSMEFCMAILLLDGKADQTKYTDAVVNRDDVQRMIERVHFYVDPEAEKAGYDKMTTILKITLKDGRTISGRADFGKGSPTNPMSYDEVADKVPRLRCICGVAQRKGELRSLNWCVSSKTCRTSAR